MRTGIIPIQRPANDVNDGKLDRRFDEDATLTLKGEFGGSIYALWRICIIACIKDV
jgi:hypothetical protein